MGVTGATVPIASPSAEAKPPAHAGGHGGPPAHAGGGKPEAAPEMIEEAVGQAVDAVVDSVVDSVFGPSETRIIREYFAPYRDGRRDLPPGLAKRETLPPGLAKRETLPPGLQRRAVPPDLMDRLPDLDARWKRIMVGHDMVVIERGTDIIVDILRDLF